MLSACNSLNPISPHSIYRHTWYHKLRDYWTVLFLLLLFVIVPNYTSMKLQTSQLSWSEHGADNAKAVSSLKSWTRDPWGSLPAQAILWFLKLSCCELRTERRWDFSGALLQEVFLWSICAMPRFWSSIKWGERQPFRRVMILVLS